MSLPLDQRYLKRGLHGSAVAKYFHLLGRLDVNSHAALTLPEPKSTIRWYMLSINRKLPWQDKKYYTCWLPTVSYQICTRRTPKSTVLSCNCSLALNFPVMFPCGVFGHHHSPKYRTFSFVHEMSCQEVTHRSHRLTVRIVLFLWMAQPRGLPGR
jgi:hypothetical protein